MSRVGWTPQRHFFSCLRFQLKENDDISSCQHMDTPGVTAGSRWWAEAELCVGHIGGCAFSSCFSGAANTRILSSAGGCVIVDVFLAV